jgi:hypothetical protein
MLIVVMRHVTVLSAIKQNVVAPMAALTEGTIKLNQSQNRQAFYPRYVPTSSVMFPNDWPLLESTVVYIARIF